jgi:hypothetical protein
LVSCSATREQGILDMRAAPAHAAQARANAIAARVRLVAALVLTVTLGASTPSAAAVAHDPRTDLFDGIDGATCRYFNAGAQLPWRERLGDWLDADGTLHGDRPFASAALRTVPSSKPAEWDVTQLVRAWAAGAAPASGIVIAALAPWAGVDFASRETPDAAQRPRIVVSLDDAPAPVSLAPTADVTLDCSTAHSLGASSLLRVGPSLRAVLQFDVAPLARRRVLKATLQLTPAAPLRAVASVGIFQLDPPAVASAPGAHHGLSERYPRDEGIAKDPDVLMATGFESAAWKSAWSYVGATSHVDRVARDDAHGFAPLSGSALRVKVAKGDNYGLDMGFDFAEKLRYEPEEVYFRYYLRLGDDWIPTVDGGKLPGLSGTYGKSGWGGRRASGTTGWSMRGQFNREPSAGNPLHGRTTIGTYAYHADMEDDFGDHWYWVDGAIGVLERNRWYCLEQRFKVNGLGARDGVLQAWVDGVLALEKFGINVRSQPNIRIERVWMNVYHGGTEPAAEDMHLYIDGVVVARKPIGCRAS